MRLFIILEGMELERKNYLMMEMGYTTTTAFGKNCTNRHRRREIYPELVRVIGYGWSYGHDQQQVLKMPYEG